MYNYLFTILNWMQTRSWLFSLSLFNRINRIYQGLTIDWYLFRVMCTERFVEHVLHTYVSVYNIQPNIYILCTCILHYKSKKNNIILLTYIVPLSLHFKNTSIMFSITRIATTIIKVNYNKHIYRYYLKKIILWTIDLYILYTYQK